MSGDILTVRELTVTYGNGDQPAVDKLSFKLGRGEILGLFGRSGCGKSTVAWTVMGMIERLGGRASGELIFEGANLLGMTDAEWAKIRWKRVAIVPQSSMSALNPSFTIFRTLYETIRLHGPKKGKSEARERCHELLDMVMLEDRVLRCYPHELSGGMRQRVSIALAMTQSPSLLILDEATTGLDVVVEADILYTIKKIQAEKNMSILMISHDERIHKSFCGGRISLQ